MSSLTGLVVSAFFILVLVAQNVAVAPLSPTEVEKIIQTCESNRKDCPKGVVVGQDALREWGMSASIEGPSQRVANLARAAKKEKKKLAAADIGEDVIAPLIAFTLSSRRPQKVNDQVYNVEHVFLRKSGAAKEDVVRPVKEIPIDETLRDRFGETTTIRDMTAFFNEADVPTEEFDIVALIAGHGFEWSIPVKPKDMAGIQ